MKYVGVNYISQFLTFEQRAHIFRERKGIKNTPTKYLKYVSPQDKKLHKWAKSKWIIHQM